MTTEFSEVTPADFTFVARRGDFHVQKVDSGGQLDVTLRVNGGQRASASAEKAYGRTTARRVLAQAQGTLSRRAGSGIAIAPGYRLRRCVMGRRKYRLWTATAAVTASEALGVA